jgi:uncharacterized membrane protein
MSHRRIRIKKSKGSNPRDWRAFWPVWALFGFFLSCFILDSTVPYRATLPPKSDMQAVKLTADRDLSLNLRDLRPEKLHLFEIQGGRKKVQFIVRRTADNSVHVAFASCPLCIRSGKPNYAQHGAMICGRCAGAMNFAPKNQDALSNSCSLPPIEHVENDRELIVSTREALSEARTVFGP